MTTLSDSAIKNYQTLLRDIGSLSRLFSETNKPFIHSRTAEYLYCKIYNAENISRSDITIDAKLDNLGVGVKTFIYSGKPSFQKIAEFNRAISLHKNLDGIEKIKTVSGLRNDRMRFVENTYGIEDFVYHCVIRDNNKIIVYEEEMPLINLDNVSITNVNDSSIRFNDGKHKYSFSISKSTILKEFNLKNPILEVPVKILDDPFSLLSKLSLDIPIEKVYTPTRRVILPMYSYKNNEKYVYPKSGLNQWNAGGRVRNLDETYLPIPSSVRNKYFNFFPNRETPFELNLPNGTKISAKVSQAGGKALMSNPNSKLGVWLLREVLGLKNREVLTYDRLLQLGIDSVEIYKKNGKYYANFLPIDSYEEFIVD